MIRKILFPVDFSLRCEAMAAFVARGAALFGAEVTILHVIEPGTLTFAEDYELAIRPLREVLEDHAVVIRSRLEEFLREDLPNALRVSTQGEPATEIVTYAREQDMDMIIMPSHSGRFRQMLLGSTTAKVINDSPCPVLTSHHTVAIKPSLLSPREWVVALPSGAYATNLAEFATGAAKQAGADLSFVHVLSEQALPQEPAASTEGNIRQQLEDVISRLNYNAPLHIFQGSLKATLLRTIEERDANLVIIGRRANGSHGERMADLTYALVRDSPAAVLSV